MTPPVERPTLPHSLEAEKAVLGAVLVQNGAFDVASQIVTAADFFRVSHGRIFTAMGELLAERGGTVDYVTLCDGLDRRGLLGDVGGRAYIASLVDGVPRGIAVAAHCAIVLEKSMLRAIIRAGSGLVERAYSQAEDSREILAEADREFVGLHQARRGDRLVSLVDVSHQLIADLEDRRTHRGQITGCPTGFEEIDQITSGWQPGELIVIAARPSVGKTSMVLASLAAAVATPRPDGSPRCGILFSLEMRRRQLELRLLSMLSNVSLTRLLSGYVYESEWPAISAAIGRMGSHQLWIDDTAARTAWDIRSECRRVRAERGLDLVVVDYVQLMAASERKRGATRNEEIAEISRSLKILADDLQVPVLLLSQLNRSGEGGAAAPPKLSSLRDSGSLEQDADIVAFLHRKNHREGGPTDFIIEKQRNGPTGTIRLNFVRETTRFEDLRSDGPPVPPEPEHHAAPVDADMPF